MPDARRARTRVFACLRGASSKAAERLCEFTSPSRSGSALAEHNPELWTDHEASMRMVHMAEVFELDAALG